MKPRSALCIIVFVLVALSAWGQYSPPSPALPQIGNNNDFSMGLGPILRWAGNTGMVADANMTHYFMPRLGFTADADLLKSDEHLFREYGYRGGLTYRFLRRGRVELFSRGLAGYARFKETDTGLHRPYQSGFSYTLGGGGDMRLIGPISARITGDFEDLACASGKASPTRYLRFGVGLKYTFGNRAY